MRPIHQRNINYHYWKSRQWFTNFYMPIMLVTFPLFVRSQWFVVTYVEEYTPKQQLDSRTILLVRNIVEDVSVTLSPKKYLSMLWNAAKRQSSRKRMQRKSGQEKGEEKEIRITDYIGVYLFAVAVFILHPYYCTAVYTNLYTSRL